MSKSILSFVLDIFTRSCSLSMLECSNIATTLSCFSSTLVSGVLSAFFRGLISLLLSLLKLFSSPTFSRELKYCLSLISRHFC